MRVFFSGLCFSKMRKEEAAGPLTFEPLVPLARVGDHLLDRAAGATVHLQVAEEGGVVRALDVVGAGLADELCVGDVVHGHAAEVLLGLDHVARVAGVVTGVGDVVIVVVPLNFVSGSIAASDNAGEGRSEKEGQGQEVLVHRCTSLWSSGLGAVFVIWR